MSLLPSQKRMNVDDFPQQKTWIGRLLAPINEFMASVVTGLNRSLTFNQNLLAFTKTIEVVGGEYPVKIPNNLPNKTHPVGAWKIGAYQKSEPLIAIGTAIDFEWYFNGSEIVIKNITGLTAGTRYNLIIAVIGG